LNPMIPRTKILHPPLLLIDLKNITEIGSYISLTREDVE
jgi:hypothetical protein